MGKRRKKSPLSPRSKRMKRSQPLQSAKLWLEVFERENLIRAYRKRYGGNWLCAIKELQLLGVVLDPAYVQKLEQTVGSTTNANRKRELEKRAAVEKAHQASKYSDSDESFYFIAGHTSGGAPYGITWEQAKTDGLLEDGEYVQPFHQGTCQFTKLYGCLRKRLLSCRGSFLSSPLFAHRVRKKCWFSIFKI